MQNNNNKFYQLFFHTKKRSFYLLPKLVQLKEEICMQHFNRFFITAVYVEDSNSNNIHSLRKSNKKLI